MTGNPKIDKIIILLNAVVVTLAVALVFYSHNILKKPTTDTAGEFGQMVDSSMGEFQKSPITFDEAVVNLYSRETRLRFLNTQMNVDLFYQKDKDLIKDMKHLIFDSLIDIAGNMKPSELNSVTGRILLETRIKNRVNKLAGRSLIKKIYFSKFIVQ